MATEAGYVPGQATAIVTTTMWLLIDAPMDGVLVSDLSQAMCAEGGPAPILDVLSAVGVTRLPSLVLVCLGADELWVLTRGEGRLTVDSAAHWQTLDSRSFTTWVEQRVPREGLYSARLTLDTTNEAELRHTAPLADGLVRASCIDLRWVPEHASERPANHELTAEWRSTTRTEIGLAARTPSVPSCPAPPTQRPEPAVVDEDSYDYLFEATSTRTVEGAAVRHLDESDDSYNPAIASRLGPDELDNAHTTQRHEQTAAATSQASEPLGILVISNGARIPVDRNILLGRSPTRRDELDKPHLVKLESKDGDVSRNHVAVEIDGEQIYVRDLGSTNGTYVTLPEGQPELLAPDEPLAIQPGTHVTLSDDVFFRFEAE